MNEPERDPWRLVRAGIWMSIAAVLAAMIYGGEVVLTVVRNVAILVAVAIAVGTAVLMLRRP